jgi:DNA-binding NarL/FixJ family response regulator
LPRISIFACESQPIVIEGLERVLDRAGDIQFLGAAHSASEALDVLRQHQPDIVLIDQAPALKTALQLITDIKTVCPRAYPVLWVQDLAEVECFRALQLGARGVLKKTLPVETLIECVRAVSLGSVWVEHSISTQVTGFLNRRGAPRLTPRESEIVRCVCHGMKNKDIGNALAITPGTVKVHLMHIFEKTGVKDRFELAIHGRKLLGLEPEDRPVRVGLSA